ncbi:MAG: amidohydrolase [Abditibacteriales bacterium]|nr:amidohydrolase [Abditibacteriales bacterium]MDW8364436.1 amidohydrolase family protein [Abditibacteriales bacterium]
MTDLAHHIQATALMDTHEHLFKEHEYVENGPDVLNDLFNNYVMADLAVAGASSEALRRLLDANDPDVSGRFQGIRSVWEKCQHTGYGEAVRLIAKHAYGMDEITPEGLEAAQERNRQFRQPGERLRILREVAHLDHVQVDDFCWACLPDESGLDFFLYDLSWVGFCSGQIDAAVIYGEVGVEVKDLASLREAMSAIFAKYAPCAIAVKSQHAYNRTLRWVERDDAEAERVLQKRLKGENISEEERLCLGDWSWARGVELAIEHNLPFKIHTGYYAGHSRMPVDFIRGGNLCALLMKYPRAKFVLMHIAYPYSDELVALAKHYPNVYADLCWAWGIDPFSAGDFVRRMIHAAPANKLFAFGGDTRYPNAAAAYAMQARRWLTRALQAEVDEGLLTERAAMALATRFMRTNQEECFDLVGTRAAIAAHTRRNGS